MSTYEIWVEGIPGVGRYPMVSAKYASAGEAFSRIERVHDREYAARLQVVKVERTIVPRIEPFARAAGWVEGVGTPKCSMYWRTHYFAKDATVSICGRKTDLDSQSFAWSETQGMTCSLCLVAYNEVQP